MWRWRWRTEPWTPGVCVCTSHDRLKGTYFKPVSRYRYELPITCCKGATIPVANTSYILTLIAWYQLYPYASAWYQLHPHAKRLVPATPSLPAFGTSYTLTPSAWYQLNPETRRLVPFTLHTYHLCTTLTTLVQYHIPHPSPGTNLQHFLSTI